MHDGRRASVARYVRPLTRRKDVPGPSSPRAPAAILAGRPRGGSPGPAPLRQPGELLGREGVDRGERDHGEVVPGKLEDVADEVDIAHHGVPEQLGRGVMQSDAVAIPAGGEGVAVGDEFIDQVGKRSILGIGAGLGSKGADQAVGDRIPLDEQVAWGPSPETRIEAGSPGGEPDRVRRRRARRRVRWRQGCPASGCGCRRAR